MPNRTVIPRGFTRLLPILSIAVVRAKASRSLLLSLVVLSAPGCGDNSRVTVTPEAPTPLAQGAPSRPITFDGLLEDRAAVATYAESGFTIAASGAPWEAWTNYGNPAPAITFTAEEGTTATGEVIVSAGGATFSFQSVDLYASTTPIPYTIAGQRNAVTVFTMSGRVPNTFGRFERVTNPDASALIDTLKITLTNTTAACCRNPMGLDNILLK